jgi:hypothetical protein
MLTPPNLVGPYRTALGVDQVVVVVVVTNGRYPNLHTRL